MRDKVRYIEENGQVVIFSEHSESWCKVSSDFFKSNINSIQDTNNDLRKILDRYKLAATPINNKKIFRSAYLNVTNKCNMNCEFCPNLKNMNFRLGNLADNIDNLCIKHDEISNDDCFKSLFSLDNHKKCSSCNIRYFCLGVCPAVVYQNDKNIDYFIDQECHVKKMQIKYNLFYVNKKLDLLSSFEHFYEYIKNYMEVI